MVTFFVFVRLTNESNGEKILFEKKVYSTWLPFSKLHDK